MTVVCDDLNLNNNKIYFPDEEKVLGSDQERSTGSQRIGAEINNEDETSSEKQIKRGSEQPSNKSLWNREEDQRVPQ